MSDWWEELRETLQPFLWAGGNFTHTTGLGRGHNAVDVTGHLRADGLASGTSEREVRGHLYQQAERAIATVEGLGYRHLAAPRIDLSGEVQVVPVPVADGPRMRLVAEGQIRLSLWRADL